MDNEQTSGCYGCSIIKGEKVLPGGVICDGKAAILAADPDVPVPGFLIITAKRHICAFSELTKEERIEIGDILSCAEKALRSLNIADRITLVQEERSEHFHIWIFPMYDWMAEHFGTGIQYLRDISEYAKEHADKSTWKTVSDTAERIKTAFMDFYREEA